MKQLKFYGYNGEPFFEYLLNSRQATQIKFVGDTLVITLSEEYDRLSTKQRAEVIRARLEAAQKDIK